MACFHSEKRDIEPTYVRLVNDKTYSLLLASLDHQAIGKAHLHHEPNQMILSDIAIIPNYQGRGYGQALVAYCIEYANPTKHLPLCLDVEADNHNAVHIYEKLGFKPVNIYDRWMIPTQMLHGLP
jgi:ribosomal protein S18 acetylase RimI-like enzyme